MTDLDSHLLKYYEFISENEHILSSQAILPLSSSKQQSVCAIAPPKII